MSGILQREDKVETHHRKLNLTTIYLILRVFYDHHAIAGVKELKQPRRMSKYLILRKGPVAKIGTLERYLDHLTRSGIVEFREKYVDYRLTTRGLDCYYKLKEICDIIFSLQAFSGE